MTTNDMEKICEWVLKGAKVSIGRAPNGRRRVKVAHGPFGIFVERFPAEEAEISLLKLKLKESLH
jgi:hypothetical protein